MADFATRRQATENLAQSIRAFADAAAETAVEPDVLDGVRAQVVELTAQLRAAVHDGAYSGLVEPPVDYSVPEAPMPLNPIIGACNPTRPDVQLRYGDGEVVGTATFTRRFIGPPGFAHGGISAMLADQIVAVTGGTIGRKCVTKALHVRFRRPLPLDEPVELWGACEVDDDAGTITARYTITAGGEVAVEGTGELVDIERMAARTDMPSTR